MTTRAPRANRTSPVQAAVAICPASSVCATIRRQVSVASSRVRMTGCFPVNVTSRFWNAYWTSSASTRTGARRPAPAGGGGERRERERAGRPSSRPREPGDEPRAAAHGDVACGGSSVNPGAVEAVSPALHHDRIVAADEPAAVGPARTGRARSGPRRRRGPTATPPDTSKTRDRSDPRRRRGGDPDRGRRRAGASRPRPGADLRRVPPEREAFRVTDGAQGVAPVDAEPDPFELQLGGDRGRLGRRTARAAGGCRGRKARRADSEVILMQTR